MCVCVRERESERKSVCVYVRESVCERERVCVCQLDECELAVTVLFQTLEVIRNLGTGVRGQ